MSHHKWCLSFVFFTLTSLLFESLAIPEPFDQNKLPPQLKPWVPWVLDEYPELFCPTVDGDAVCVWPGELRLELTTGGGTFSQQIITDMEVLARVPGDSAHWPENVTVDDRPATVLEQDGLPVTRIGKGDHRIKGELSWSGLPEGIRIPADTAIVKLAVNGEEIRFPRRDEAGMLWLQSEAAREEDERLDLTVMRKIRDGVPLSVMTRIVLRASGKSREVALPKALLDGTVPVSVESSIPARVDKDGNLGLQVRAGTHTVTIVARTQDSPDAMRSIRRAPPWPEDEIWVWQADEELRQVVVSGPPGIDPSRTNLPEDWRGLPAFLVVPDDELRINTIRRGEPEPPPDQVVLERSMWMDLDGRGFTIRDYLSGTLNRTWRLDLKSGGELGHVAVESADQLITEHPTEKSPGVELRKGILAMTAEWRIKGGSHNLPAVGWSEDVQRLGATLHLPPGWTLLSASGVDELPGTWWNKWNLFGFFFVLVTSLAIGKLTKWYFGLVAFFGLGLSYQEPDAPFMVWITLLVALGLLKVLPESRVKIAGKLLWWFSLIWLVIELVPFSVAQFRGGLFPQVSEGMEQAMAALQNAAADHLPPTGPADWQINGEEDLSALAENVGDAEQRAALPQVQEVDIPLARSRTALSKEDALEGSSYSIANDNAPEWLKSGKSRFALQQDPKAVVQTGPGVPEWEWKRWRLTWSGPVDKGHRFSLYLISPGVNLILSLLRVLLLVAVSLRIALESRYFRSSDSGDRGGSGGRKESAAVGAAVLVIGMLVPGAARADDIPTDGVLTDLLERLTRQDSCGTACVSTSRLDIEIIDDILTVTAEAHVGAPSSWTIPGPAKNWVPETVEIDGKPTNALVVRPDGYLHVRAEAGVRKIVARGHVPPGNTLALEFAKTPHRVSASAPGWAVEGLREDGRTEGSIQITRRAGTGAKDTDKEEFEEGSYPPWLEITRTLDLGMPWLVHTSVQRVSPVGTPVHTRIPLLNGESVTESEVQVEDGAVVVSLGRNDTVLNWSSTLEERPELEIAAPEGKQWTERWVLKCSPIWQCDFKGLAPIRSKKDDRYEPTFLPWPGERLALKFQRPGGVEGQSTTIDSATLALEPGIRHLNVNLTLSVRSSRGGTQEVTVPKGAKVQELNVDGAKQPFRQENQKLLISLKTGRQDIHVRWQQEGGISWLFRAPEVKLGGRAANVRVVVNLPAERWLIWTGGPVWGPAILFWGYLLTILIAGFVLGRVKISPLRSWQWMLLALGLTQIPVQVALIIVFWLITLEWRARHPLEHFVQHNALQILLGIWTAVAMGCLISAIYKGLAVQPDMQVQGCGSWNSRLIWYVDRTDGGLPTPWIVSFPILVWKLIMLVWALWLAGSIVKWAPWAWRSFSSQGLWKSTPKKKEAAGEKK